LIWRTHNQVQKFLSEIIYGILNTFHCLASKIYGVFTAATCLHKQVCIRQRTDHVQNATPVLRLKYMSSMEEITMINTVWTMELFSGCLWGWKGGLQWNSSCYWCPVWGWHCLMVFRLIWNCRGCRGGVLAPTVTESCHCRSTDARGRGTTIFMRPECSHRVQTSAFQHHGVKLGYRLYEAHVTIVKLNETLIKVMSVFGVVRQCQLQGTQLRFGEANYLHLQGWNEVAGKQAIRWGRERNKRELANHKTRHAELMVRTNGNAMKDWSRRKWEKWPN
jgi:hypothetical protein